MNMEGEESQKDYDVLALAVYTSVSTGRDVLRQTGTGRPVVPLSRDKILCPVTSWDKMN